LLKKSIKSKKLFLVTVYCCLGRLLKTDKPEAHSVLA